MTTDNTKPNTSILQRTWYEPRRFFFWLGLLSPFVYGMVLCFAAMSNRVPPLLAWIGLAAVISFLIAAPCFVLSWLPPLRRLFAKLLRHKLLIVACIVTLFGLFYSVENWRGRSAWNHFQQEWRGKGVGFAMVDIIPTAIPDEENMFAALPWEYLRFSSSNGVITWKYEDRDKQPWLGVTGPLHSRGPEVGNMLLGKKVNLQDWQEFYRGSNNLISAQGQVPTNYFPITSQPQTPAKAVLLALTKYQSTYDQIRAAAQRPKARFWVNYEDGFGALLPHLAKLKGVSQYLRLKAAAELADDQSNAALADIKLSFRISEAIETEPFLISQLVRVSMVYINLLPVWDGLVDHRWNDAQLAELDQILARTDLLADYQTGMSGERVCSVWSVDFLHQTGDFNSLGGLNDNRSPSFGDQLLEANGKLLFRLTPTGWFDQNKLSLARMHVNYIRPLVDVDQQLVSPRKSSEARAAVESQALQITPYDLFSRLLVPALDRAAQKFAAVQTHVNLARIAVALERYRLARGEFPISLDALNPTFLKAVPHDIINGQPLKYRRTDNGRFVLYSVGWNGTDDGGNVGMTTGKNPTVDQKSGDWVWQLPKD